MSTDRKLVFFHGPKTRSTGVFILLEELGAPYDLRLVNMKIMEHRQPAFLAINPMGKVPAIQHKGRGKNLNSLGCGLMSVRRMLY